MRKIYAFLVSIYTFFLNDWVKNGQLGGYVHDTAMGQHIPCTAMHYVTGTWSMAAGATAGTIAMSKAAAAETAVITIPVFVRTNSVALKGAYVKTVEVDYEILTAAATSMTASANNITRGADVTGLTVTSVPVTQDLAAAVAAATVAKHKLTITITTPAWLLNTEYLLIVITAVCATTTALKVCSAVANFTERI